MMDFKKYSKEFADSMESATDEIELSINLILNKYGLSGNNLSALQMLLAKEILKESEDMGVGLVGDITRDFVFKLELLLNKYQSDGRDTINNNKTDTGLN